MKKLLSILMVLCILMGTSIALASDQPFESGVSYNEKFNEYGAKPSMLNFGYAKLSVGESLYDAKTTTVKKTKVKTLCDGLDKNLTYYIYAKWQFAYGFDEYSIDAMLVMTDPNGNYYATYDTWDILEGTNRCVCSWFFDVTDCLTRCRTDNGGTLPKGEYAFSMFFNNMSFRVSKVKVQ